MSRRHYSKWHKEVLEYQEEFAVKTARSLRDALAIMCFGEARHVNGNYYSGRYRISLSYSRDTVFAEAYQYDWRRVEDLISVFNSPGWYKEYGGPSWAKICQKVLTYSRLSPKLFCDSVFGAVHNGGIAFNRGYIVHSYAQTLAIRILETKRNGDILNPLQHISTNPNQDLLPLTTKTFDLLEKACKMQLVDLIYGSANDINIVEGFTDAGSPAWKTIEWEDTHELEIEEREEEDNAYISYETTTEERMSYR